MSLRQVNIARSGMFRPEGSKRSYPPRIRFSPDPVLIKPVQKRPSLFRGRSESVCLGGFTYHGTPLASNSRRRNRPHRVHRPKAEVVRKLSGGLLVGEYSTCSSTGTSNSRIAMGRSIPSTTPSEATTSTALFSGKGFTENGMKSHALSPVNVRCVISMTKKQVLRISLSVRNLRLSIHRTPAPACLRNLHAS